MHYLCGSKQAGVSKEEQANLLCSFCGFPRNLILHPEEQSLAEKSDHSSMSGTVKTQALTPLEVCASQWTLGI